jgi:hypothetical protein
MKQDVYVAYFKLMPGIYHYKYIVDGLWQEDLDKMKIQDEKGFTNNVIKVNEH